MSPLDRIDAIRDRRPVFLDADQERTFRRDGFALVPLLGPDLVAQASSLHRSLVGSGERPPIAFDSTRADRQVIAGMTQGLAPVWETLLPAVFDRHRPVFSSCVVKAPGEWSGMEPHDDRSFVDERRARSVTMWIPLVDTSPTLANGTLAVLPHSEHLADGFGGTNIATWYAPFRSQIEPAMVELTVAAGTAVVYDSRAVHGSAPNASEAERGALVVVLAPEEEPLVHAVAVGRRARRLLSIDEAFHLHHSPMDLRLALPPLPEGERFDDPPIDIDPLRLAPLLGVDDAPIPLAERPRHDRFEVGRRWSPRCTGAERLPAGAVAALDQASPSLVGALAASGAWSPAPVSEHEGRARRLELASAGRVATTAPAGSVDVVRRLVDDAFDAVDLLVVEPGASWLVEPGPGGRPTVYFPLITPAAGCGLATAGTVAPFELGLVAVADATEPYQVFNDGPDPLPVLVLEAREAPPADEGGHDAGRGR